ncbi:ferrochelatase [Planctomyces sp. SCGC AG-212-M04]|nr:ferrochelatase [Planctomyces sp. SCGC AG-212-M04]
MPYDSLLVVSFGGPEGPDDVIPFLENVLRGRNVPRERMLEVAEHYQHFGGVSPINAQNRALIAALRPELDAHGIDLPIYFGNRNWRPFLPDTLAEMKRDGRKHALAFVTSGQSSYSGCRQYRENIIAAQAAVGDAAPQIDKLRVFYNHPDYIAAQLERIHEQLSKFDPADRDKVHLLCTAHSIPMSMANSSDYVKQLTETTRLLTELLGFTADRVQLVYQSRSGRPEDPWLEPDVKDAMTALHQMGHNHLIIAPIGFISDHIEILFDLDEECVQLAHDLRMTLHRAGTVGTHPRFITMIRKLIQERLDPTAPREAIGHYGPNWDMCPINCCPAPQRPARPITASGERGASAP